MDADRPVRTRPRPAPGRERHVRSVPAVARLLGVSVPRVHRLLDSEGVPPAGGRGHTRVIDRAVVGRLIRRIGAVSTRLPGCDRTDMLVLAAIARAPLGMVSARAVARAAGVSPTAASAALERFKRQGLVTRRERNVVQGSVRRVSFWVADLLDPSWTRDVLAAANAVVLPVHTASASVRRVSPRYGHAFWNVDLRVVDTVRDADFIATRLLQVDDAGAWAWAARHLPSRSLRRAARGRGMDAGRKALVENLLADRRLG